MLAIDSPGDRQLARPSGDRDILAAPLHIDVLAAVRYLRSSPPRRCRSSGARAWAEVPSAAPSIEAEPGEIERLVFLGSDSIGMPEEDEGQEASSSSLTTIAVAATASVSATGSRRSTRRRRRSRRN